MYRDPEYFMDIDGHLIRRTTDAQPEDPFAGIPNADGLHPEDIPEDTPTTLPADESDDDYEDRINGEYLRELFADSAAEYGRDH